ncbi:segregation/condensation protein A [uncultured Ruminococcus sp.]|uniref:segregation/condensation protein A n=1 Tax=uncultured Ruminococcus sp. TaxID=165186 RepID=UPI0025D19368|nr:segregation/condensation protein A [uncultured Ruminococcus sp.]
MSTARFKLDMFEGPLDLLLHLINKHKLNIYDIEIAVLLEQYLEYMAGLEEEDYEDAADFLEMAARLIYIKTASLLPKDDEGEELKKELQGSLIEYSLCKMAAARLKEQYAGGDIFVREPVKLPVKKVFTGEKDPQELLAAYMGMSEKARHSKPLKAEMFKPILSRKIVSVTSKIIHVLKMLITRGECFLDSMYDGCADKSERVAVFLAVLELTRSGRIFLNDDNTRVYMNSASKKRKIESAFDEAEIAAENGAENAYDSETAFDSETSEHNDIPENKERELSEEENSEKAHFSDISPYGYNSREEDGTPLPYDRMYEPPERTVYKSESRQRSALPVLKIELSPELQKIVEQGRKDMPPDMAEENTEAPEKTTVIINLAKPVSEDTPAAEKTTAPQESIENTEKPEETAPIVNLAKPVSEDTPAAEETTTPQEIAENTEKHEETAPIVNLAKPVSEDTPAAKETTTPQEIAENTAITADTSDIPNDETVSAESTHLRENLYGFRYYWGAYGWLNGRLKK